tara:strand:+ start:545 stop:754 length:210 start_codon:yes stop_codon:yes gene_type:complete
MKTKFLILISIIFLSLLLILESKEPNLKGIQIENVAEMEETPPELYIYFNNSKYMIDTKTNELTHIAKF